MVYQQKELLNALQAVIPFTHKDNSILQCVKFYNNKIIATNNEIYIEYNLNTEENFCCNGKDLLTIIKSFPDDDIVFSIVENTIRIKSKKLKGNYKLPIIPIESFPEFSINKTGEAIEFPDLVTGLENVSYAAMAEEAYPIYNGVFLDDNSFVATDTFRLASCKVKSENKNTILFPLKYVLEIQRLFSETVPSIIFYDNMITVFDEQMTTSSRIVDENYVDWKAVIPKETKHEIVLYKSEFQKMLSRLLYFSNVLTNKISFEIVPNKINLSAKNNLGDGKEILSYEGEIEFVFAMNGQYILDALSHIASETIAMQMSGKESPVVFLGEVKSEKHIIMPIQE